MTTPRPHPRDPLHGITLATIVTDMAARHGWEVLASHIPVRCFEYNPSVKSSLTFLRKTPWARQRLEAWYVDELPDPEAPATPPADNGGGELLE